MLDLIIGKTIDWNSEKGSLLKESRNVSFEDVVVHLESRDVITVIEHPNKEKYPHQWIVVFRHEGYIHLCPFVIDGEKIFLKTIYLSSKSQSRYS